MSIYLLIVLGNLSLAAVILAFVVIHGHRSKKLFIHYEQFYIHKQLMKARHDIREQTLTTISKELHDNVGQMLNLARLHVSSIDVQNPDQLEEKILQIKKLLSLSINDVRFLSRSLKAEHIVSVGLVHAISQELDSLQSTGRLVTKLEVSENIPEIAGEREVTLFRIIQEALQNVMRHASATALTISIASAHQSLSVEILDNGCGFDIDSAWPSSNGLKSMQTRCILLRGKLSIKSRAGEGTQISILVPINDDDSERSLTERKKPFGSVLEFDSEKVYRAGGKLIHR